MTTCFNHTIRHPDDYEVFSAEYDEYMEALREVNEASAETADSFPSDEEMETMYRWAVAEGLTV